MPPPQSRSLSPGIPALRIRNLRKVYPARGGEAPVVAVDGIDVEIPAGQIVAFLGPNGAGKTTTLDIVLGLIPATSGEIEVFGTAPREAVNSGRVSAVLQTGGLLRDLKVRETVEVIAALHKVPHRVDEVIETVGIGSLAGRKVSLCSGGEQQRLRFALALLSDPDLLILDEPTAGMDATARRDFWATMRAETRGGRTVIFATHYLEEAQEFAERTILVAKGRVVADQPTEELRSTVAGRTVSASVSADAVPTVLAALRARPDVNEAFEEAGRIVVSAANSDDVARALLLDLGGSDLEILRPSLESAFFALTAGTRAVGPVDVPAAQSAAL